jgi:hypothetical protein
MLGLAANFNFSYAADPVKPPPTAREGFATFNVREYLTVGNDSKQKSTVGTQDQTYLKSSNPIASFILQIINFISLTVASLSFLGIVIGGFMLLASSGNENLVNRGKETITYAIIGLVLTLSSYFIVSFVQNLLFDTAGK